MHIIHIRTACEPQKVFNVAEWNGLIVRHQFKSAIPMMARMMIGAGIHSEELVEVHRYGRRSFMPIRLGYWAERTITEDDAGILTRPYKPFPKDLAATSNCGGQNDE